MLPESHPVASGCQKVARELQRKRMSTERESSDSASRDAPSPPHPSSGMTLEDEGHHSRPSFRAIIQSHHSSASWPSFIHFLAIILHPGPLRLPIEDLSGFRSAFPPALRHPGSRSAPPPTVCSVRSNESLSTAETLPARIKTSPNFHKLINNIEKIIF